MEVSESNMKLCFIFLVECDGVRLMIHHSFLRKINSNIENILCHKTQIKVSLIIHLVTDLPKNQGSRIDLLGRRIMFLGQRIPPNPHILEKSEADDSLV